MATAPLIAAEENYNVRPVSGNGGPHQPQAIAPAADVAPRRKLVCGQGSQLALVVVLALSCGALGGYYVYTRIFNRCPHGEPCISVPSLGSVFGVPSTRYPTVHTAVSIVSVARAHPEQTTQLLTGFGGSATLMSPL